MYPSRKRQTILRSMVCLALGMSAPAALRASVPPDRISYQGLLRDSGGNPLTGDFDVVFRFYSASAGGDEILVDSHTGAADITVSDGLFDTHLGGGTITDGSGPNVFLTLTAMFQFYGTVHMQIEVESEVLLPRVQLVSVPYAFQAFVAGVAGTAENVDGIDSLQFLRSDASDQYTSGILTLNAGTTLNINGTFNVNSDDIRMNADGPDGDSIIWFYENGSQSGEFFYWDDSEDRFVLSDDLEMSGTLQVGSTGDAPTTYNRFGTGDPASTGMNNSGDILVSDDLEILSSLLPSGDIRMHQGGPDGDQNIYFYEDGDSLGEVIRWDNSIDKFVISDDLHVGGAGTINLDPESGDGVGDVRCDGGVTIRVDQDNDESGPNAGVFAVTANNESLLLLMQGTNEANLELDNGVVTDAFDFAEAFRALDGESDLAPGDVVSLAIGAGLEEHCRRTTAAYDGRILGVVSTNPAFTCGMSFDSRDAADPELTRLAREALERGDEKEAERLGLLMDQRMREIWRPVAMLGRVPCKVDGQFGAIHAGDPVTSSNTPGHAMLQTRAGPSIGIAMEDWASAEKGTILVLVQPSWREPAGTSESVPPVSEPLTIIEAQQRKIVDLESRLAVLEKLVASQNQTGGVR